MDSNGIYKATFTSLDPTMGLQFDELGVIRNKQLTRLLPRWDGADKQLQW
jgi:hypothetical protein